MTIYNPNVDIFNDNVHTNFGLNKSIRSQIIEQKNPEFCHQSRAVFSVANLRKIMIYNKEIGLVTDDVYTKFGLDRSIRSRDIKKN